MCDNCGKDHPTFEEIAPEILMLDRAMSQIQKLEEDSADNGFSMSINPYAVDYFARRVADETCVDFMTMMVNNRNMNPVEATERFGAVSFTLGFSIAMCTFHHWVSAHPGSWGDSRVETPSPEEVSAFVEDQKRLMAEMESQTAPTAQNVIEALKNAGIEVPNNLTILGLDKLGQPIQSEEGEEKQTGDSGFYL